VQIFDPWLPCLCEYREGPETYCSKYPNAERCRSQAESLPITQNGSTGMFETIFRWRYVCTCESIL